MQEVDEPVHKVGNFVKNQGKQECKLCVAVKKKKIVCLSKGRNDGRENWGVAAFLRLACGRVISGSVLRKRILDLVSANQSRSPHFHAQASDSDWPFFHAIYCVTLKKKESQVDCSAISMLRCLPLNFGLRLVARMDILLLGSFSIFPFSPLCEH